MRRLNLSLRNSTRSSNTECTGPSGWRGAKKACTTGTLVQEAIFVARASGTPPILLGTLAQGLTGAISMAQSR